MELKELLDAEGVENLDQFKAKIRKQQEDVDAGALAKANEQIAGLEEIKKTHSEKLAEQGRTIEGLTKPTEDLPEKKTEDDQDAKAVADAQLIEQNAKLKLSLSEEDDAKLVEAYKDLAPDVQKLVDTSPEGFSTFAKGVLGFTEAPHQKTFRQPVEQVKLSAEEVVMAALGKIKPDTAPRLRPNGMGFSASQNKPAAPTVPLAITKTGSIFATVQASKAQ